MIFGTPSQLQLMEDIKVKVGGVEIEKVENYKYLGMKLDCRLTFSDHIAYIKGKTLSKIKLLGRLSHIIDSSMLLMLYKVLILPIIDYGDIVYHKLNHCDAVGLQRLQNVACRAILKADIYTHIEHMHDELDLSLLYQRRCQHICNMMHKFLNGQGPPECTDAFTYEHEIHNVQTRRAACDLLCVPRTKLRCSERDFMVEGPKLWNQVPMAIRQIESHDMFKNLIKTVTFE